MNVFETNIADLYAVVASGVLAFSVVVNLRTRVKVQGGGPFVYLMGAVVLLPLAQVFSGVGRASASDLGSMVLIPGALMTAVVASLMTFFFLGSGWGGLPKRTRGEIAVVTVFAFLIGLLLFLGHPTIVNDIGVWLTTGFYFTASAMLVVPGRFVLGNRAGHRTYPLLVMGFYSGAAVMRALSTMLGSPLAGFLMHAAQITEIVCLLKIHCCLIKQGSYEIEVISSDGSKNTKRFYPLTRQPELAQEEIFASSVTRGRELVPYIDTDNLLSRYRETAALLRNRAKNLEHILDIAGEINSKRNLQELLDKIVESVRENLGFRIVLLRVLNKKTEVFEARAFAGLNNDAIKTLSEYRLPMAEYKMMTDERFRISRSYFISHEMKMWEEDEYSIIPELGDRAEGDWHEMDMLIVPLETKGGEVIGYLSVDDPVDASIPTSDTIEILEIFANQAVTAIMNAELFNELERKNRKLEEAAEQLSSLSRLKSDFVSTISHELRTPLTSIRAYTETLLSGAGDIQQETLSEFLSVIGKESERLGKMIDDVLNLSRLEAEDMRIVKVSCDLCSLIREVESELEDEARSLGVQLKIRLPGEKQDLKADREMIKQVVQNLMSNAIKFTPRNGEVFVNLDDERSHLRLTVEDTGIGIPEGQLDAIFDQFHQADTSSTREFGGSGLGLTICKNIIDWHDGRIWVENRPGLGAKFVVLLPKKDALVSPRVKTESSLERRYHRSRFLELLVETVAETMQSRVVSFMSVDAESNVLRVEAAIGLDEEIVEHAHVEIGTGVAGMVAERGETVLVKDVESDERIRRKVALPLYDTRSFVSAPIKRGKAVVGVFNVTDKVDGTEFDASDASLLDAFCKRVSYVWEKVFGLEDAIADYEKVQTALRGILDAARFWGDRRNRFFGRLAERTAERVGLGEDSGESLLYGMTVYDLGMTHVSTQILHKRDPLSEDEVNQIRQHVVSGSEIIDPLEYAPKIKEIVLYHHERFDGTGYPEGLRGEAIPPEARIVGIVDTFRSLLSDRPYRPAMGYVEALAEIRRGSGKLFENSLTEKFIQVCHEMEDEWIRLGLERDEATRIDSAPQPAEGGQ